MIVVRLLFIAVIAKVQVLNAVGWNNHSESYTKPPTVGYLLHPRSPYNLIVTN